MRKSGLPNVRLAIHGARVPHALHVLRTQRARIEALYQIGARLGVAIVDSRRICLLRACGVTSRSTMINVYHRLPCVSNAMLPAGRPGTEDFAIDSSARLGVIRPAAYG